MLKKIAIAILKKELKKLDVDKVVETLVALLDEKAREILPKLVEKIQEKLK